MPRSDCEKQHRGNCLFYDCYFACLSGGPVWSEGARTKHREPDIPDCRAEETPTTVRQSPDAPQSSTGRSNC